MVQFALAEIHRPQTYRPDVLPGAAYTALFHASPLDRIALIREGLPAADVKALLDDLDLGQGTGLRALGLSVATVNKKAKNREKLSPDESERVIGLARLVGQLEVMIAASGNGADFDARAWLARWLTEPLPALGHRKPADLLDTMEGQALVATVLAQMQGGAYA